MAVLHPDTLAALQSRKFGMINLIKMEFSSTLRLASSQFDVVVGGDGTYTNSGLILEVGEVEEASEIQASTLQISFAGADTTIAAVVLGQEYIGVPLTYMKAIIDPADYSIQGTPINFFKGTIDSVSGIEDDADASVTVEASNHWSNFEAVNGRRCNPVSQKIFFPADEGMQYAGESIVGLRWGR